MRKKKKKVRAILACLSTVSCSYYISKEYFVPSARELKRLDNIARSPVFVHTNNTIEGIAIIRASGTEQILCREFEAHNDNHSRAFFGFLAVHRWFGLRLDLLCSLYAITTLFCYIFFKVYFLQFWFYFFLFFISTFYS